LFEFGLRDSYCNPTGKYLFQAAFGAPLLFGVKADIGKQKRAK
jgi:hypothetical protein